MFLQSIPSPSGFTRRRPRSMFALISCLLVATEGLCGEVASTRPILNVNGSADVQAFPVVAEGGVRWNQQAPELVGELNRRSNELSPRQVLGSSTSPIPSTSATTTLPSSITPQSTASQSGSDPAEISTSSSTATSSASTATTTAVPSGYQLPQPFDSTLGTNFTSTACPSFFATFLADPEFMSCAPFSLLLGTSSGFFQAQRSPTSLLPYVLNASCSAPSDSCAALMDKYARQIKRDNTCGPDLAQGNPLALEALEGFQNYRLYKDVGCQKDNSTEQAYCFADASANPDPDSLYFYYLGEGTSLPSGTIASCDYCLQDLLATYSRYATNATLPISKTYASGRSVAALACGPNFAPLVSKTASRASRPLILPTTSLLISVFSLALVVVSPLILY